MTPLQAAKEHCANWNCGACLGMYYKTDLSVDWSRHKPLPKCLLAEGKRCPYFENIIIPMRMALILGVNCPPKALVRARQDCATALNA